MVLRTSRADVLPRNDALVIGEPCSEVPPDIREQLYHAIAPWQIRLLRIHPSGDLRSDLICDLLTADLVPFPGVGLVQDSKIIQYEALSYSWGYPALTKAILCNGILLPVSETMYDALCHIRNNDTIRYLWTDVCCINQSDLTEKSRQVEMMFTIFQKAFRVVAWIGTPSPEEELLFTLIDLTDQYDRIDQHVYTISEPPNNDRYHRDHYDKNFAIAKDAAWRVVTTRALFRRTWIRQEFFAARDLEIVCGRHACAFLRFANVMDQLLPDLTTSTHKFVNDPDPESRAILCYSYFRSDYEQSIMHQTREANTSWFNTIMRSTLYQATLPQDKIFAALGIARALTQQKEDIKIGAEQWDITHGLPPVDYKRSVSLVYQDFVKHTINTSRTLRCLSMFSDRSTHGTDLPSWAVDLRVDIPRYLIPGQMASWGRNYAEELRAEHAKQRFDQHGILVLHGRRVGVIGTSSSTAAKRPNPWSEGYPRNVLGTTSPMLESCLSSDENWFPENENTHEDLELNSRSRDRDAMADRAFARLQKQCKYNWKRIARRAAKIVPWDVYEWNDVPPSDMNFYAFVSELVQDGDLLVHLNGADLPFALRRVEEKGRYVFLGPAILAVGIFKYHTEGWKEKASVETPPVFEWSVANVEDQESQVVEKFILI